MVVLVILIPLILLMGLCVPASALAFAFSPPQAVKSTPVVPSAIDALDVSKLGFTYPVVIEPEVAAYLTRFAGSDRRTMTSWLARVGLYEDVIKTELLRQGCPSELLAVAMIESGFFPDAFSRAGAVGVWQFMLPTARSMGARVDDWIDERRHVQASTRLACKLLLKHQKHFGSWHLALAAYNAGEGAVGRAVLAAGTNDFWEITRLGLLPREARNYVPKAIASMIVLRQPSVVGLEMVATLRPPETAYVSVSGGTDLMALAKSVFMEPETLMDLNPHLRRAITPPDGEDFALVVPADKQSLIASHVQRKDTRGGEVFEPTLVRFGETVKDIAWRRGLSARRLRFWNGLGSEMNLEPGQQILVPSSSKERSLLDRSLVSFDSGDFELPNKVQRFYPVLSAQSLTEIANWFGVTLNEIRLWNGLSESDRVPGGIALRLWLDPAKIPANSMFVNAEDVIHTPSERSFRARRYASSARKVIRHRIRSGDTLWKLSKKYRTPVSEIRRENGFGKRANLRIGRRIKIPILGTPDAKGRAAKREPKPTGGGTRYTVRSGDTLWKLSKRFRTSVKKLRQINRLSRRARLRIGQRLRIPRR